MHEVKVQVQFTADTKYGSYGDALYFTEDEWAVLTEVKLESMKQARIDKWVAYMDTAVVPKEPTKADLIAQVDNINSQVAELNARQDEINLKIAGM